MENLMESNGRFGKNFMGSKEPNQVQRYDFQNLQQK